jgi:monoamine oxidase
VQTATQITLGFADGTKSDPGHACICSIPAHHLRRSEALAWRKDLPEAKRRAASELQYARLLKTAVLYEKRFWPRPTGRYHDGFSVVTNREPDFCFDATHRQGSFDGAGILCSYSIGDKADDLAGEPSDDDVARRITEAVKGAVAAIPGHGPVGPITHQDVIRQAWQGPRPEAEFHGGAYALFRPAQWYGGLRKALQEPFGLVHFAGEHLADAQGFMEGAVVSGEAAADEVLKL